MEALAADLNVNGLHAWGRLYDTLTGKMEFEMTFPDGHSEAVPMSRRRALMSEPYRALREAAFHAWTEAVERSCGDSGGRAERHRGDAAEPVWPARPPALPRCTPLFDGAMSRKSLDAMLEAIHAHIELPRRALRKAAKLQGTSALHYFDLEAPQISAPEEKPLSWDDACATVDHAFSSQPIRSWVLTSARCSRSAGSRPSLVRESGPGRFARARSSSMRSAFT
jgi:oligoendopeptidase F